MKRISEERKIKLVDDYLSANLTQAEFCEQKGIRLSSLQRWLKAHKTPRRDKRIKSHDHEGSHRFVEAVISEPAKVQLTYDHRMLTIRTPSGYLIEVPV